MSSLARDSAAGRTQDALPAAVRTENTVDSDFAKANFECLCHLPVIARPDFRRGIFRLDFGADVVWSGRIRGVDRVSRLAGAFSFDLRLRPSLPNISCIGPSRPLPEGCDHFQRGLQVHPAHEDFVLRLRNSETPSDLTVIGNLLGGYFGILQSRQGGTIGARIASAPRYGQSDDPEPSESSGKMLDKMHAAVGALREAFAIFGFADGAEHLSSLSSLR